MNESVLPPSANTGFNINKDTRLIWLEPVVPIKLKLESEPIYTVPTFLKSIPKHPVHVPRPGNLLTSNFLSFVNTKHGSLHFQLDQMQ